MTYPASFNLRIKETTNNLRYARWYSPCGKHLYRASVSLVHNATEVPRCLSYIVHNPGKLRGEQLDSITNAAFQIARRLGYTSVDVAYVYSARPNEPTSYPLEQDGLANSVNMFHLFSMAELARTLVVGWGDGDISSAYYKRLCGLLTTRFSKKLYYFGMTQKKHPISPYYVLTRRTQKKPALQPFSLLQSHT